MGRPSRFSPELRERAIRLVMEQRPAHPSEWAALQAVEVQHAPSGAENGPQGTKRVQRPKPYGCCAFLLRDLAEIDGGEGGIRSAGANAVNHVRPPLTGIHWVSLKPPEPHESI